MAAKRKLRVSAEMQQAIEKIKSSVKIVDPLREYEYTIDYHQCKSEEHRIRNGFYDYSEVSCKPVQGVGLIRKWTVTPGGAII